MAVHYRVDHFDGEVLEEVSRLDGGQLRSVGEVRVASSPSSHE